MNSFAASRFLTITRLAKGTAPASAPDSEAREVSVSSDESLLANVCAGNNEALAALFHRYARLAFSIGRRILRDDSEAEDLVQDIFLYIHRKCRVYNSAKGPAGSWIVQTIYYQALQRRMQLTARGHYSPLTVENCGQDVGASSMAMEYDQSLEGTIGRARLREMLDCLTEDQRETLRLHFFEGYTLSEIAQEWRQPVGNIRHHFYRGIEKLRSRVFRSELQDRVTSGTR
jgi:RNA polymerase sigma-70 factor (ECF subfamily)